MAIIIYMRKKRQRKTTLIKINIDSKTNEPSIVDVPDEEVSVVSSISINNPKYDFIETKTQKSIGKQIVMTRILGINKQQEEGATKRQKLFMRIFTAVFLVFVVGVLFFTAYNDFFSGKKELPSFGELMGVLGNNVMYLGFAISALIFCLFFKGFKNP